MKTLILGDIHGHDSWKKIINIEQPDKIIFLGDYFDCFGNISPKEQVDNFNEILELKEKYGDNCILCIGNHDCHYANYDHKCSGYNYRTKLELDDLINHLYKSEILVPFYVSDGVIYSHAGMTKTWCKSILFSSPEEVLSNKIDRNDIFYHLQFNILNGYNPYGDTISQSPVWVRPTSLLLDKVDGYKQVVGHTHMKTIAEKDGVWFCDSLPNSYLTIIDGEFKINILDEN